MSNDEVDEEFLREAAMTREELLDLVRSYEKIHRPRRSREDLDESHKGEPVPFEGAETPPREKVALGTGVDPGARDFSAGEVPEGDDKSPMDLFRDFGENLSPEYRDIIEAYSRELAEI